MQRFDQPEISVVIPLFNEEESIPALHQSLTAALESYGHPYEIIIVDDGSRDRSYELLADLAQRDSR
ncbi:MAG: glycosyltransferase, partial [Caldilineaceae bacterium]|nr:glycosyltransferase [Caldilineaceae bacterium]